MIAIRPCLSASSPCKLLLGAISACLASTAVLAEETIEEVVVIGSQVRLQDSYAGDQLARGGRAGMLGNLDMMDAPFAGLSYTQQLIRDQQAKSVADVLQNDPVVRVAKGFGNFQELYVIRGFPVFSDDMTYNGIYGILPRQYVAAELLERVEVFRGANTFLNGAAPGGSGIGGAFNLVPKRAGRAALGGDHWLRKRRPGVRCARYGPPLRRGRAHRLAREPRAPRRRDLGRRPGP